MFLMYMRYYLLVCCGWFDGDDLGNVWFVCVKWCFFFVLGIELVCEFNVE